MDPNDPFDEFRKAIWGAVMLSVIALFLLASSIAS